MDDLDDQLRRLAHQGLADAAADVDTAADLAAVRERSPHAPADTSRRWLTVAAAAVLIVVGVGALAWTRRGSDAPSVTIPPAPATTPAPAPASATSPPPTSAPGERALATATPDPVSRGDTLTITPAGAVGLMCNAIVTVLDEAGDFVGQIIQGEFRARNAAPEPTYPACLDSTPPGPHSFTIPNATPTGALVMCIAEATQAEGCARVTVAAATAPTTTTAPGDPCWSLPLAPPSLPDGSAPGDPELSDAGAHWGSPPNMVTQFLGDAPQEVGIVEAAVADGTAIRFGAITAAVAPVGDDPLGQKLLEFIDNRDGCVRTYNITVGIDLDEAKTLALRWAIGFWTGEPAGDPTPTLGLSVYGAVYDVNDVQGTFEFVGVTEFAADGSSADATDRARASLDARHRLPGGGVLTMDMASGTSCGGMFANRSISVIAANGSATTLHPDLLDARSFVVSGTGSVFTTRLVCPDGAEWGSPGTYEELLRFDPASSTVEVLATYPAEPQVHRWITAVGPQERYAAFRVAYALEHSRYEVVDLADPLTPIDLPTTCPVGRNLVGPPQFLDGAIVVARRCAEPGDEDRPSTGYEATGTGELRIDAIYGEGIAWTLPPLPAELTAYSATLSLDAAMDATGRMWVLVQGIDSVENPPRTFAVGAGDEQWTELTRFGIRDWAFDPADVLPAG